MGKMNFFRKNFGIMNIEQISSSKDRRKLLTDTESIRQDLVDTQKKLLALSADVREIDNKRAQTMAEIQAQQGVARFLMDKVPEDERAELINSLQAETEESADSDS